MKKIILLCLICFLQCVAFSMNTVAQTNTPKKGVKLTGLEKELDSLLQIGIHYYGTGEILKSIECYNKIITEHPNYARAYFNRGNAWTVQGNQSQGCKDWEKAKSLGHIQAEEYINKFCGK